MFSIILENEYHDKMELTHNINYDIVSTDGFDPPDAVICTTPGAGTDGSIFNSSRLENRTITLTIAINYPAEENRLTLYRFFSPKRYVKMRHITETRDVYTEGTRGTTCCPMARWATTGRRPTRATACRWAALGPWTTPLPRYSRPMTARAYA